MTDWVERYHQDKRAEQDQKGGEGSGHWGHAGRPGQVGGSTPGSMRSLGRVNREYFTKGPGKAILSELTDEEREGVIHVLTHAKIQPRHLKRLQKLQLEKCY